MTPGTKLNGRVPTWCEARARLVGLRDGESVSFEADEDAWLIVLRVSDFGYLVTGCGIGERDYFTLIERSLGEEPVTAFDGGDTRVFVRYALVSEPVLLGAVGTYLQTGERDRGCEWVPERDAVYE